MRNYLICYDIADKKRLRKVAKSAYAYALGGQKSSLEAPLEPWELEELKERLSKLIDSKHDRIHIIPFYAEPYCLGRANPLRYDEGVIIL